jgi:restriction endonuclease S subunit
MPHKIAETVKSFLAQKKAFEKTLKAYLKDKKEPLEERWKIFELSKAGENHESSSVPDYNTGGSPYDDFYMERGQQQEVFEILKTGVENDVFDEESSKEFQEHCLKHFIRTYTWDW